MDNDSLPFLNFGTIISKVNINKHNFQVHFLISELPNYSQLYPNLSGPKGTAVDRTIDGGLEIDFTNYEEAIIKLYLDLVYNVKPVTEIFLKVELGNLLDLVRFLVELGAIEKESEFEIELLEYCLKLADKLEINLDIRYKTALVLSGLKSNRINQFIPNFLTKMNYQEYLMSCMLALNDLAKTTAHLNSQISTEGITDMFRDFILPKNNEVILRLTIFQN